MATVNSKEFELQRLVETWKTEAIAWDDACDLINGLIRQSDQMAARVERLKYIVSECHQQILDNEYIDDLAHEAAFGKPSASQLLHDADFACEIAAKWMGEAESIGAKSVYADELIDIANELRNQATEQEKGNG